MVTEFGIAYLFGKSVRERALALIEIAHPDFRESLLDEAKRQSLVPAAHRLGGGRGYLVEEERVVTLKSGSKVMLRPARGSDVQSMQVMFHRMSSEDVYMRFFRSVSALTYEEAQRLCNVDFEKDVAFVAVVGPRENEEIVGTGAYFLNPSTNLAEVAYMIVPEWQGSGLGAALQQRLKEFAMDRGVRGFVAEFLQANIRDAQPRQAAWQDRDQDGERHLPRHFAIRINDWRGACVPALRDVFIPKPLRQLSLHAAGIKLASGVFVAVHSVPLQPGDGMGGFRRLLALS